MAWSYPDGSEWESMSSSETTADISNGVSSVCQEDSAYGSYPPYVPPGREESQSSAASGLSQQSLDGDVWTPKIVNALERAFEDVDGHLQTELPDRAGSTGTTALVALVGSRQIYVGHCGDSRAVLCRGGAAIPLTCDHKPDREDEEERVKSEGGRILNCNGHRVMGILAMSRAIGDVMLRPFVIPSPEVTVVNRSPEDELILLATDGLWDFLPNQDAVDLARKAVDRATQKGARRASACRIAACVLATAAVERGSRDNITVVVMDLRSHAAPPTV